MKKRKFSGHNNHHNNRPDPDLISEVLQLHSLWRKGPPTHTHTRSKNPKTKDWSIYDTFPPHYGPGWSHTAQEHSRVLGARIQLKGIHSCSDFFDDVEDDDDVEDYADVDFADVYGDDLDDGEYECDVEGDVGDGVGGEVEVGFFEKLFKENEELRGFYVNNCKGLCGSEFYCLVCGGIGRKFRNCVSLVHHSMSVSKNQKRKKAHRVYGFVICKLLGWDLHNLPSFRRRFQKTIIMGEGKKHADEDSAVAGMELCDAATKQNHSEINIAGLGWSASQRLRKPISQPDPAQELARVMGVKIQLKGVKSCTCLFDGGDDIKGDVDDHGDAVEFFEKLFEEEVELKGFYEKNCVCGDEFYCLVCGAIGNELGMKYKNCISLVEHSIEVSMTENKKAHRAYGNAICKALGWDVKKLLPLGPSFGEASCQSLEKNCEVIKDEKNHNDEDSIIKMEMGNAISKESQKETETVPDVVENDNVASVDAECIPGDLTRGEGEVKNLSENDSVVEMEGCATNASHRQVEPEGIPNTIEKDNVATKDAGCIVSVLTRSECEREAGGDGSVVDNSENAICRQENVPKSDQEAAVSEMGEGCSVDSKPIDSGLSQ